MIYREVGVIESTFAEYTSLNLYLECLRSLLLETAKSQGKSEEVYPLLEVNLDKLNTEFVKVFQDWGREVLSNISIEEAHLLGAVTIDFSELIQRFPLGNYSNKQEIAIAGYKLASSFFTRKDQPVLWANAHKELGKALSNRLEGDQADNLEEAISHLHKSLWVFTLDTYPDQWAGVHHLLGGTYIERIQGERPRNLEQSIFHSQQALRIFQFETHPDQWAGTQGNLASAYVYRIQEERADNLEEAIYYYHQALRVFSIETHPQEWADTQNNLGNAYLQRVRGIRADNLEQAIGYFQRVRQIFTCDTFPDKWATTQQNLGVAYIHRIRGQQAENLEQAIHYFQEALEICTRDTHPNDWAMIQTNLANAYRYRLMHKRVDNLEQARFYAEQASQIYTKTAFPENWARTQNSLAAIYLERIQGDRADNLDRTIYCSQEVIENCDRDAFSEQWAQAQLNLGSGYAKRLRGERSNNLEQSIIHCQKALEVFTDTAFPEEWAHAQNNLGLAYLYRVHGDRADNLEQSIHHLQQALKVQLRIASPVYLAMVQLNLGAAYIERVDGQKAENQEQAICYFQQALQVCTGDTFPHGWATSQQNLGAVYSRRILGKPAKNMKQAIAAYQQALEIFHSDSLPVDCRRTAHNLGTLYFEQRNWKYAVTAYTTALVATETLYQSCLLLDSKAAELKETADLPHRAAYALTRVGNLQTAVEVLEQGRARGLSESLDRDRTDLGKLKEQNETLYTQYKDITQQLRNLEAQQRDRMVSSDRHNITPEVLRNEANCLRQELTETIGQIREQPGYETFLTPPTYEDVQKAVTPDNPATYLLTTPAGSLALVITPDNIHPIWLNDFTNTQITSLLQPWFAAYDNSRSDRQTWLNTIDTTTRQLWDTLMGPIIQQLQEKGIDRTILIPTGFLSLLPLHAAWTEDESKLTKRRYAFDDIHITYAPNAKSLTAAQVIAERVQSNSILAIDNLSQDLDNSDQEVQAAIASFLPQATILRHHHATTTAVKTALPNAAIAHFYCHGTANLNEPLNSGLAMSDGLLTLKDIFALNLAESGGLRLAILSACETGIQGLENADEAISLPTGLLQAGVAAVIASLWSVSDLSTMMLLTRFYDLWRIEGLEIDQALRQAQQWVRDTTNGEKIAYFKDFIPTQSTVKMPASTADYLYKSLILSRPDARDFSHPFHWAAFTYTGV